jgi:hypothetical protein
VFRHRPTLPAPHAARQPRIAADLVAVGVADRHGRRQTDIFRNGDQPTAATEMTRIDAGRPPIARRA